MGKKNEMHPNHLAIKTAYNRALFIEREGLALWNRTEGHLAEPAWCNSNAMLDDDPAVDFLYHLYVMADLARVLNKHADATILVNDSVLCFMFTEWKKKLMIDPRPLYPTFIESYKHACKSE